MNPVPGNTDEHCILSVGLSWQDKVTSLRAKMTERKITWFVVTALDEIACMVNFSEKHISAITSAKDVIAHSNGSVVI